MSKIQTQETILRARQAELGAYLEGNMNKPSSERNPTVEDLVLTEDDRLALLESRLQRLRAKLSKQRQELQNFININSTILVWITLISLARSLMTEYKYVGTSEDTQQ